MEMIEMVSEITAACTFTEMVPALGLAKHRTLVIETPATANSGDTITFLKSVRGTVIGGTGFDATNGVIETLGIALAGDTYTVTVGTGSNAARGYVLTMAR